MINKISCVSAIAVALTGLLSAETALAQDRFIDCRKFGDGITITIDGDPSDWPIEAFGNPATLPDIPEEQRFGNNATDNAFEDDVLMTGDHFEFDPNKVLVSANTNFEADGEDDFTASTYIGWNDEGFYLLNIVTDSQIGLFHGNDPNRDASNQPGFTNDGIEMWFDNDNDRFPFNINDDQTSEFDLQTAFSIDLVIYPEEFGTEPIMANGLPLDFAIFRSALNTDDDAEKAILDSIPRAVQLDDKPAEQHTSYVQEIMFPWGVFPSFEPDEPIGFNINWVDWDDAQFHLQRWHQAGESSVEFFREMRFTSDNPLGGGGSNVLEWTVY